MCSSGMHVQKWDGEFVPAFVKTVGSDSARLYYPGPPEEHEDISRSDFSNKQQTEARVLCSGNVPWAPWLSNVSIETYTPTIRTGESYHSAKVAAMQYDGAKQQLGATDLPRTVGDQVRANLAAAVHSTIEDVGRQFHSKLGACDVFGQAAISHALMSDVKAQNKTVKALAERKHSWKTTRLQTGMYVLAVGSDAVAVKVTGNDTDTRTAVSMALKPGTQYECHCVQTGASTWQRYVDGEETTCIDCKTNGCAPLLICVCDLQKDPQCPMSKTQMHNISEVLQRQMDAPLATHAKFDLAHLPLFRRVLREIIEYQFSLWCAGKQTDEPTGESVYEAMCDHCGKEWVELYCGTDRVVNADRFEREIVNWLQDKLDKCRSNKKRKGLVKRFRDSWVADSDPIFFTGQRVYARWTTETGKLVANVNRTASDKRGFPGVIVAAGEAPCFYRVAFDGEPDHPGIPAKYITTREREEETNE